MDKHWLLYADDSSSSRPFLFHCSDKTGRAVLAPQYSHLACPRCRKFDELKALNLGVFGDDGVAENVDYLKAYEGIAIVSARMRDVINDIPESKVTFFPLANASRFFVAVPETVFLPDRTDLAFDAKNLCPQCGRFRNVVWGTERPHIARPCHIGMFQLENRISVTSVWVIGDAALQALQSLTPPLKGYSVDKTDIVLCSG